MTENNKIEYLSDCIDGLLRDYPDIDLDRRTRSSWMITYKRPWRGGTAFSVELRLNQLTSIDKMRHEHSDQISEKQFTSETPILHIETFADHEKGCYGGFFDPTTVLVVDPGSLFPNCGGMRYKVNFDKRLPATPENVLALLQEIEGQAFRSQTELIKLEDKGEQTMRFLVLIPADGGTTSIITCEDNKSAAYQAMHDAVGGLLNSIDGYLRFLPAGVHAWCYDECLLDPDLKPSLVYFSQHFGHRYLTGNLLFTATDDEGEVIDLTDEQINLLLDGIESMPRVLVDTGNGQHWVMYSKL